MDTMGFLPDALSEDLDLDGVEYDMWKAMVHDGRRGGRHLRKQWLSIGHVVA